MENRGSRLPNLSQSFAKSATLQMGVLVDRAHAAIARAHIDFIMIENARWVYDKALKLTAVLSGPDAPQGEEAQALMQEILKFRHAAQRYASAAAPYVHPRLAAIQHDHRSEDGSVIRPVLIINGIRRSRQCQ
jgi:hypothetical protein